MSFRVGLYLFLALVVFDGAARKWLFPGSEQIVYIAKDVLLVGLLLKCFMQRGLQLPPGTSNTALMGWLSAYVVIAALQALNPSMPSLMLGVLGLKAHVLYAGLLLLVPAAFRDTEELARAFRYLLIPVTLVLAFGAVQFYLPPDHPLNRYVRGTAYEIATFGIISKVRITSTFSYVSGMTAFIFFALCLNVAFLARGRWSIGRNKLAYACILAAIVVTPMTGARWIYYMVTLCLPLFLYGMLRAGMLQTRFAVRMIVLSALATGAISLWSIEAVESLEYRRHTATDTGERIRGLVTNPIRFGAEAGLLGFGAGSTHQAAPALVPEAGFYTWLPLTDFEDEPGRIMLELGIVGFFVAFGLRIYLCLLAWRALLAGESSTEKAFAAAAFVFFVAHLISPIVFNVTGGALYWLFAGIVATIMRDQHQRRVAQVALLPGGVMAVPARTSR